MGAIFPSPDRCQRCNEQLMPDNIVWLELNNKTNLYSDPAKVHIAEEDSQGSFTFGATCAKHVLKNGGICQYTYSMRRPAERTTDLRKVKAGFQFTWGYITGFWEVGEYAIVQYEPYNRTGEQMYHTWVQGKDTSEGYMSLDAALASCIAYKYEGITHHGDAYFMRAMLA